MPTVGEHLREARVQANLTLRDVSEKTRIPRWILADIERDDLSRIPGGIFTRGYLTSFARTVGLDGDAVWAHHQAETRTCTVEAEPVAATTATPTTDRSLSPWVAAGIAAAVLVTTVVWRNAGRVGADAVPLPPSEVRHAVTDVVPVAAAAAGPATEAIPAIDSRGAAHVTRQGPAPLVLNIHATSDVWLDASADGERRAYRLYTAGDAITIDAQKQIALRVGDASAVTYTINGAPGRALGGAGIVRNLVITPDDYTAFVDRPR